jgi:hypothetical protein
LPLLALLLGCTTTITKTKPPVFALATDSIAADLNALISCEHINIDGKDIVTNGADSSVLVVEIINGKNVPGNQNDMARLAHYIASAVKGALRDKDEYSSVAVLFVRRETDGAVTKRSWTGKVFASAELPAGKRARISGESFFVPEKKWSENLFGRIQGLGEGRKDSASDIGTTANYEAAVPYEILYIYKGDVAERNRKSDSVADLFSKEGNEGYPDFNCYAFVVPRMMDPQKMEDMHDMNIFFPTPVKAYKRVVGNKWTFLKEATVNSFEEYSNLQFNVIYGLQ